MLNLKTIIANLKFVLNKKGLGTDEQVLIQMLCTKNAREVRVLSEAFTKCKFK